MILLSFVSPAVSTVALFSPAVSTVALFTPAVSTVALFTGVFTELVYDALSPWKKKKNVIAFIYKGLKQSLIQQTKPNCL